MLELQNLSPHFKLEEFTRSQSAARLGIDNTPHQSLIDSLTRTAYTLEIIRLRIKRPINITSGFRCLKLNEHIGGSPRSAHLKGLAADFVVPGLTPQEVIHQIRDIVSFDQLIREYDRWVHIGLATPNRGQVLRFFRDSLGNTVRKEV